MNIFFRHSLAVSLVTLTFSYKLYLIHPNWSSLSEPIQPRTSIPRRLTETCQIPEQHWQNIYSPLSSSNLSRILRLETSSCDRIPAGARISQFFFPRNRNCSRPWIRSPGIRWKIITRVCEEEKLSWGGEAPVKPFITRGGAWHVPRVSQCVEVGRKMKIYDRFMRGKVSAVTVLNR